GSGSPLVAIRPRVSEETVKDSAQGTVGSRSSAGDGKVPGPDEPQPSGGDSSSTGAPLSGAKRTVETYLKYNSACSKCNMTEPNSKRRVRLCDRGDCGRWVHKHESSAFATIPSVSPGHEQFSMGRKTTTSKCCVHNNVFQSQCPCRSCVRRRRSKNRRGRGGRAAGRGAAGRAQGTQTGRKTQVWNADAVYVLPAGERDESTTLSVGIYGANRVITSVNSKTKGSSCSRPNCHT
ncbi:unnamed protein product, partial [Pylaiella littoralis]